MKTGHWNILGRLTLREDATSFLGVSQKTYEVGFLRFLRVYRKCVVAEKAAAALKVSECRSIFIFQEV